MVRQIEIEAEAPGDSRTMFRLRIDSTSIAKGLTAVQAHLLVGEILERITVPKSSSEPAPDTPGVATPDPSPAPRRWSARGGLARLISHAWA
jgi:hypothetical protein